MDQQVDSSGSQASPTSAAAAEQHDDKSNKVHSFAKKIARHFPTVPVISSSVLKRAMDDPLLKDTIVLVDVRQAEEVEVSTIPGSLTATEFDAKAKTGEMTGKTVVCFCTVGYRSSSYAAKLQEQGFEAKNLEGGIVRWSQKRYPLVVRQGGNGAVTEVETKRVHVYGKDWALQPDDYEAVVFKSPFMATLRGFLPRWAGGK